MKKKLRINHKKFSKPMFGFVIGDSSTDCGFDLPSFAAKVIPNRQAEKKKKCSRILKWMGTTINVANESGLYSNIQLFQVTFHFFKVQASQALENRTMDSC